MDLDVAELEGGGRRDGQAAAERHEREKMSS
jgi:hypothetical protein